MPTETDRPSPTGGPPPLRTFDLRWENHKSDDDFFPDGMDCDQSLLFHATASTREEMIDREGLRPRASGVELAQAKTLVECFHLLGWCGASLSGYSVLRSYTLKNDFRDGERSPLYLSEWPVAGDLLEDSVAENHLRTAEAAEHEYFKRLPRLVMSCCPFDGKPLIRTFDPYGFDGFWWHQPRGGDFQAHTGPEVPYVIPRILSKPGITAVISQLDMTPGHIAYVIAYFAERRPPVQELASNWPRTVFLYTTALGEHRWRFDNCKWDFDLGPWLERGKIRWCQPRGDNRTLSDEPASQCPYLEVRGERQRMVVQRDQVWGMGSPDGGT